MTRLRSFRDDAQQLTGYFYAQLHEPLRQDYPIVTHPGPGVMRLAALCTGGAAGKSA